MLTRAQRRDLSAGDTAGTDRISDSRSKESTKETKASTTKEDDASGAGPGPPETSLRTLEITFSPHDAHAVEVPGKFGRYILLERMGEGGMAEVFRAVVPGAQGFRRQVVLKRILARHSTAPTFVGMFAQEARISALLHHPNIVQVFDFGQVDGSYFLAMEFLDGWEIGAINRALRSAGAKMPIEVALHIAHEVLLGLSYAHTLKVQGYQPHIVHRDVSPSNIMCLRAGGVKLLDFGVATATGAQESNTADKASFCGKVAYSAPEYALGRGVDARIDLFAVGVVLWEMLAGQRLFRRKSERETLSAVLGASVVPPSAKRPAISAEVDRIVMKALERDPERRYQSAAMMAEDLERVLEERRYQPKMLPRLLDHLFGEPQTGPPVTAVEQLIQSGSTIPPTTSPRTHGAFTPRENAFRLLRSGAAALIMIVGSTAIMPLVLGHGPRNGGASTTVRRPASRARTPEVRPLAPAVRLASLPAPPEGTSAHRVAPTRGGVPPGKADRRAGVTPPARRKPAARRARETPLEAAGLINSGRPIDPFAEATSRSPRP